MHVHILKQHPYQLNNHHHLLPLNIPSSLPYLCLEMKPFYSQQSIMTMTIGLMASFSAQELPHSIKAITEISKGFKVIALGEYMFVKFNSEY